MTTSQELESLHLSGNQLRGAIPASLGNLQQLQELYLEENANLVDQDGQVANALRSRGTIVEI